MNQYSKRESRKSTSVSVVRSRCRSLRGRNGMVQTLQYACLQVLSCMSVLVSREGILKYFRCWKNSDTVISLCDFQE